MKPTTATRFLPFFIVPFAVNCSADAPPAEDGEIAELEQALCASNALSRVGASASSIENVNFPAAKAIDGNATTRWSSAFSDPQWLEVDLGAQRWINRVRLSWEGAASANYDIQVRSTTSAPWTTIYTDPAGNGGVDDIANLGVAARYVRMYSRARITQWGNSLFEMEIFGDTNTSCNTPTGTLIPGRVEAEAYNAFFDTTTGDAGNGCPPADNVDTQLTSDPKGGTCNVGWTTAGEWLQYNVRTTSAQTLNFTARVASALAGKSIRLELDGVNIGSLPAPASGWQSFADRTLPGVEVSAGNHTLRVVFETGSVNLNYIDVSAQACADAVSGNNRNDSSRFNIVFVGGGFADEPAFVAAARRAIDIDGVARTQTNTDGLMQIPVFKAARNRFNFFYVTGVQPFPSGNPPPSEVESVLLRWERVLTCQNVLPNRVIPIFLFRHVIPGGEGYPYGSLGRQAGIIADCDGQAGCGSFGAQQTNVHELMHTVTCLTDEYGGVGDGSSDPVPWEGTLENMFTQQFWDGDSYSACLANAPWRSQIGNGCGQPGVIDCFKPECINTQTNPPTFSIPFFSGVDMREDCCLPGRPECISEVACFSGGFRADTGIFRPTAGNVLRNGDSPALNAANFLSPVQAGLVSQLITKGPAVGLHWHVPPYDGSEFSRDCDMTLSGFDPDR